MTRKHQPSSHVVTAFVKIPEPVPEGKVRCAGCSAVVAVSKNGRTREHHTPAGEPCAYRVVYAQPVAMDEAPPVELPQRKRPARSKRPPREPSRLDAGSNCRECGKWLPGERQVCGACSVANWGTR